MQSETDQPRRQTTRRPLVAIPACRKFIAPHPFHAVGEKYIAATTAAADALPMIVPALGEGIGIRDLLPRIDGLLLTGSPSNVEPHRYRGAPSRPDTLHDPHRDATTLPLARAALEAGVPVFAICRGCQELNVALGGTLHQNVQELDGMLDHREDHNASLDVQYGPRHTVRLTPGGLLARLASSSQVEVNSLHAQGIDRLAPGLTVEATATDGLIEAFRVDDAEHFAVAVQWHPEWRVLDDAFSTAIFRAFGDACRRYAKREHHDINQAVV